MAKVTKLKTKAQLTVPQNKAQCSQSIFEIGEKQRRITTLNLEIEAVTSEIKNRHAQELGALGSDITELSQGVQTWCEANRDTITDGGKVKYANLVTGEVKWRQNPPSVISRATEKLLAKIKELGFESLFIKAAKPAFDKEAMLKEPAKAAAVGIEISTGVEEFVIEPYEEKAAA